MVKKNIYITLAWINVILGVVGIFLPLLPTTPFLILAAYFFSNSSEKWYNWLLNQPYLGDYIKDWKQYQKIPIRAKVAATILMIPSYILLFIGSSLSNIAKYGLGSVLLVVLVYIWTRKS